MAPRFHAERYLRLFGERELTRGRPARPGEPPIAAAAEALVAIGVIDKETANRVVGDYARALALRGMPGHPWAAPSEESPGEPTDLVVPRIVACDRTVDSALGSLHVKYVILADDATTLSASGQLSPAAAGVRSRPPHRMPPMARMARASAPPMHPIIVLGDDRGATQDAHFSGGFGPADLDGEFRTATPLAPDTAWIEVDGTRIDLPAQPLAATVRVESHDAVADPAREYLWHRIAAGDNRFVQDSATIEAAADALVAAGALEPDDPVINEVCDVMSAMGGRPAAHLQPVPAHGGGLAKPWASLLNPPARQGPRGTVALGAVTPVFDGVRIAALVLASEDECFRVTLEVSPAIGAPGPGHARATHRRIAWWAADDRGNHYLGHIEGWSSHGSDRADCQVVFTPPLDPKATNLDLIPTTLTARAIISIPLPDWSMPS